MSRDAEHIEQSLLFQWAEAASATVPHLRFLFAIPNGGQRHIVVAKKLKREGVKRGVPDVCLPVPKGQYHGLYIELKADKNRPTPEQKAWLEALARYGYDAHLCFGWEEARNAITTYLGVRV